MRNAKKTLSALLFSSAVILTPFSLAFGNELVNNGASLAEAPIEIPEFVPPIIQPQEQQGQKVNINLASYEQLISLPGIGRVKAAAIINYRKEVGMFKTLDEIQNIKGIGVKLFTRLEDMINI